jgi:NADPH-dependent 2,4-dienoyl-CoA reductase/sulfur reductase-like enzyme
LNDQEAIAAGFPAKTCYFETWDHKVYYPPAYKTRIRLTADRNSKRILGCQILGCIEAEISKRIDIIAAAIHKNVTVPEFIQMDLSYTPPLSSPWDPLQMAAQAWE